MTGHTLILDQSPHLRGWIATALQCPPNSVTHAEAPWELFAHLARRPFVLVVVGTRLANIAAPNLLAMVRTAGVAVPFLLILPLCSPGARAAIDRMAPAEIVEDWTDTAALRASRDRLCATLGPGKQVTRPGRGGALPSSPGSYPRSNRPR